MSDTVLINVFEVPAEREEEFLQSWHAADALLRASSGYASTRLHRAVTPDARFRFINVAQLASVDTWKSVIASPEFRDISAKMADFHPSPGLYTVAVERDASQG
jgi:heme oxygenase (mycobilin-producing)